MPFCPNCKSEYVVGVTTCRECGAELTAGPLPGDDPARGPEYMRLVTLADPSAALVLRASLSEAGIPAIIQTHGPISGELASVTSDITEDYAVILVPEDCLVEAKQIVAALESSPVEWPEGMEPEE